MRIRRRTRNVDIDISTDRIENNAREAQKLLNMQIVADCDPLIPFQQGALRNSVIYPKGIYGDEIEWNTPYAHYQYVGEVYGPNIPFKDSSGNTIGWYSPPVKHPMGRKLQYHTTGTGDHWFEKAKERHKNEWLRLVRQTVGRN